MNVFLDSSALAKRYVKELGSDRVETILSSASSLGVSVICLTEIVSALSRRLREKKISPGQYARAKQALLEDIADASVLNLTNQVMVRAVEIIERWQLRSSDAIHVACAAEWPADKFVSADRRQCAAAREFGLMVEELGVN